MPATVLQSVYEMREGKAAIKHTPGKPAKVPQQHIIDIVRATRQDMHGKDFNAPKPVRR